MKKILKLFLILFILVITVFGVYAYKIRSLAHEGNKLFEQRCLLVNPTLISYKKAFLIMADIFNNSENYEDGSGSKIFGEYIFNMRLYLEEENKWLEAQSLYINRWDFKLFEPWYIKQAADYQLKMYEAYRDNAKYILETVDTGNAGEEILTKSEDAKNRKEKYSELYFNFSRETSEINDWRKILGNVLLPEGCTEKNMTIPDTSGSIDWEGNNE